MAIVVRTTPLSAVGELAAISGIAQQQRQQQQQFQQNLLQQQRFAATLEQQQKQALTQGVQTGLQLGAQAKERELVQRQQQEENRRADARLAIEQGRAEVNKRISEQQRKLNELQLDQQERIEKLSDPIRNKVSDLQTSIDGRSATIQAMKEAQRTNETKNITLPSGDRISLSREFVTPENIAKQEAQLQKEKQQLDLELAKLDRFTGKSTTPLVATETALDQAQAIDQFNSRAATLIESNPEKFGFSDQAQAELFAGAIAAGGVSPLDVAKQISKGLKNDKPKLSEIMEFTAAAEASGDLRPGSTAVVGLSLLNGQDIPTSSLSARSPTKGTSSPLAVKTAQSQVSVLAFELADARTPDFANNESRLAANTKFFEETLSRAVTILLGDNPDLTDAEITDLLGASFQQARSAAKAEADASFNSLSRAGFLDTKFFKATMDRIIPPVRKNLLSLGSPSTAAGNQAATATRAATDRLILQSFSAGNMDEPLSLSSDSVR